METLKAHKRWSLIATSLVAGVILAILGPYGTHQFPGPYRVLFWTGLCVAGGLGTGAVNLLLAKHQDLRPWHRVLLQSLGATLVVWVCFFALNLVTEGMPPRSFYVVTPFYIWVISVVICSIGELMRDQNSKRESEASDPPPGLYDRMKLALRGAEIYALSAEDHYVRIHTSKGDDLVLMRLSDAIKETAPLPGLQTHRSWWVAESGVKKVVKQDSKLGVLLQNNVIAPVSRGRSKHIKEANWT